jgi:hypothetical protein
MQRMGRRSGWGLVALVLTAGLLGGCDDRLYWDGYASGNPMLFFAPVSCALRFQYVPASTYYHVSSITSLGNGAYQLGYAAANNSTASTDVVLTQVWTYGLRYAPAFESGGGSGRDGCAVVVAIPYSATIKRPYWLYADPDAIQAQNAQVRPLILLALVVSFFALAGTVLYVMETYADDETQSFMVCLGSAVGVFVVSLGFGVAFGLWVPTQLAEALDYYAVFDALPRSAGSLLPLPWETAARVFVGPPYPTQISAMNFAPFFWATGILHALWFGAHAFRIVLAVYWAKLPLPIEQSWETGVREGRVLNMDEIATAMQQTLNGRSDWELAVLRRKAHAFALKLRHAGTGQ